MKNPVFARECFYCKEPLMVGNCFLSADGNPYVVCDKCYHYLTEDDVVREVYLANLRAALSANQ